MRSPGRPCWFHRQEGLLLNFPSPRPQPCPPPSGTTALPLPGPPARPPPVVPPASPPTLQSPAVSLEGPDRPHLLTRGPPDQGLPQGTPILPSLPPQDAHLGFLMPPQFGYPLARCLSTGRGVPVSTRSCPPCRTPSLPPPASATSCPFV